MKSNSKKQTSFSRLLSLMLRSPFLLGAILLGSLAQVILTVYFPILMGRAIDLVVDANAFSQLEILLGQMLLLILVNTFIQWLTPLLTNKIVYGLVSELRQQVYETLHQLPLAYLDKQSVGDIVARIATDSEQLTNGLIVIFNQFLVGILTIGLTIATMASLDSFMMLIVIVLTPLSLFVARFIAQKSYFYYKKQTSSRGEQASFLEESLAQLSLVQSFNAQDQLQEAFYKRNEDYADYSTKAIFSSSTVHPTTRFINAVIYAILAGVGALRIMGGNFTVGTLTTFLNYASQYTKPFNDISAVLSELQSALACSERLFAILDQPINKETGQLILTSEQVRGSIDFRNVWFSYDEQESLIEDFNISIPAGCRVAIVGPTGAGKSTLINLLMRFYEVDQGEILLDGVPITHYTRASFRQQIGMVLQETWLKNASIFDNIAYGHPNVTKELVVEAAKAANADFFIQQLQDGYDTIIEDNGNNLSHGQRQLLSIARVFVRLPQILILDEATSSIDTRTEILVQGAFEKLMQTRTSFIIAHRLSTIRSADIIIVMNHGKIVEYGNHLDLMTKQGFYYQMQKSQEQ